MTVGAGHELLQYHDIVLVARDSSKYIRLTANDTGSYSEACDFWVGEPDTAFARSLSLRPMRPHVWPANNAAVAAQRRKGEEIFALDGARVGRPRQSLAPGVYLLKTYDNGRLRSRRIVLPRR